MLTGKMSENSTYFLVVFLISAFILSSSVVHGSDLWIWTCATPYCTRSQPTFSTLASLNGPYYPSVEICRLVCGPNAALWPLPSKSVTMGTNLTSFKPTSLTVQFVTHPTTETQLNAFIQVFKDNLPTVSNCKMSTKVMVQITTESSDVDITWTTDESYELVVVSKADDNSVTVTINAATIFGARHALTTLSQLIAAYNIGDAHLMFKSADSSCLAIVNTVNILDAPIYPHRGLLLDTSRNFLSVGVIKKHMDAMGASKLNVLHWHATDTQSFPLQIKSVPNMTLYGAYSSSMTYAEADVIELKQYARTRGIQILMEIDGPSHAGNGWQWTSSAGLGKLALCVNFVPWRSYCIQPPCGQLNPTNPNLYTTLGQIYSDVNRMVDNKQAFHLGGDEVFIPCWNKSSTIRNYLASEKLAPITETFYNLWSTYMQKAMEAYDTAVGNNASAMIVWSSHLTNSSLIEQYLPKERFVVQTWTFKRDPLSQELIDLGYRLIFSTKDAWYLDHGVWGSSVYHSWYTVYNNVIPLNNTLGGEVCMWGEYVDDHVVLSRTWPRAAAIAERLWTNPKTTAKTAEVRFARHRERLVQLGVDAEAIEPNWCYQNENRCF